MTETRRLNYVHADEIYRQFYSFSVKYLRVNVSELKYIQISHTISKSVKIETKNHFVDVFILSNYLAIRNAIRNAILSLFLCVYVNSFKMNYAMNFLSNKRERERSYFRPIANQS